MDMFTALADPTRRHILEMLANKGQLSASTISSQFRMSAPAVSQHLKVLREAKLVDMEKRAQQRLYQINPIGISQLEEWIQRMSKAWEPRFLQLEKLLEKEKKKMTSLQSYKLQQGKGGGEKK